MLPKLLIFASGTPEGGGSGFKNLVLRSRGDKPDLRAEIVGVVSQHEHGGVRQLADALGIPFFHFPGPYTAANYRKLVTETGAEWVALSGWIKRTVGLDPARTFNIHPGPLPRFGGKGMYSHYVHDAVHIAYRRGELTHSAMTMHFVTDEYDAGPPFFEARAELSERDTAGDIQSRVNVLEHHWQPIITDEVIHGRISWDGKDPRTLRIPRKYREFLPESSRSLIPA